MATGHFMHNMSCKQHARMRHSKWHHNPGSTLAPPAGHAVGSARRMHLQLTEHCTCKHQLTMSVWKINWLEIFAYHSYSYGLAVGAVRGTL